MIAYRHPYTTIAETFLRNAIRHMTNSGAHAAAGRFDYADGSAIKATRNFIRAANAGLVAPQIAPKKRMS